MASASTSLSTAKSDSNSRRKTPARGDNVVCNSRRAAEFATLKNTVVPRLAPLPRAKQAVCASHRPAPNSMDAGRFRKISQMHARIGLDFAGMAGHSLLALVRNLSGVYGLAKSCHSRKQGTVSHTKTGTPNATSSRHRRIDAARQRSNILIFYWNRSEKILARPGNGHYQLFNPAILAAITGENAGFC
jgi:hypothetical protein